MATTLQAKLKQLPKKRRDRIDAHAKWLIARENSLQELRKARELTQERMAEMLNIRQENISRLEKRSDLMISTLRSYIEAMGGKLNLVVEFPEQEPVAIDKLFVIDTAKKSKGKKQKRKSSSGNRSAA